MKKLLIVSVLASLIFATMASCTSSRRGRTGCPMTEKIIH